MNREFHRWWSNDLQRNMDLLVFGHDGPKVLVFPTSMGRYFEYEDNKMIATLADRLENGWLQIYCVDSVDTESWYNKQAHPYWRLQRHLQYERYILNDVLPLMWNRNWNPRTIVTGCSFGAYHALNFAMKHPDKVTDCVCMGGAYDIKKFLNGWSSDDVYFNNPPDYLANCTDGWRYNHLRTVLSTGEWDMCWNDNARMAGDHGLTRHSQRALCLGRPELSRLAVVAADGAGVSGITAIVGIRGGLTGCRRLSHARVRALVGARLTVRSSSAAGSTASTSLPVRRARSTSLFAES